MMVRAMAIGAMIGLATFFLVSVVNYWDWTWFMDMGSWRPSERMGAMFIGAVFVGYGGFVAWAIHHQRQP